VSEFSHDYPKKSDQNLVLLAFHFLFFVASFRRLRILLYETKRGKHASTKELGDADCFVLFSTEELALAVSEDEWEQRKRRRCSSSLVQKNLISFF